MAFIVLLLCLAFPAVSSDDQKKQKKPNQRKSGRDYSMQGSP